MSGRNEFKRGRKVEKINTMKFRSNEYRCRLHCTFLGLPLLPLPGVVALAALAGDAALPSVFLGRPRFLGVPSADLAAASFTFSFLGLAGDALGAFLAFFGDFFLSETDG